MSYIPCAKTCWKKLSDSAGVFSTRINAQTRYEMKQCWSPHEGVIDVPRKSIFTQIWSFVKHILLTIKILLIVFISLISYIVVFVLTILRCIIYPCPLSNEVPKISSIQGIIDNLRQTVNEKLTWFNRAASLFTTPFKETGFSNSWDEYDFWLMAKGEVQNVAYSWDGFETIDIKLINITVFKSETALQNADLIDETSIPLMGKFIRIEVRPNVLLACNMPQPIVAETMIFKGQLLWDRDGFLEIHPKYGGDLVVVS
jgi:hypothetical protein